MSSSMALDKKMESFKKENKVLFIVRKFYWIWWKS